MSDNNGLVKYEPMLEILTYSGKKYYVKSSNMDKVVYAMKNKDILMISKDCVISGSSIDTVDPVSPELSMVEKMLVGLSDTLKDKVKRLVKERKAQEKTVTEQYIQNIIDAG